MTVKTIKSERCIKCLTPYDGMGMKGADAGCNKQTKGNVCVCSLRAFYQINTFFIASVSGFIPVNLKKQYTA
jgi:hypothetical protein